jgi:acyl-coenzyme A thioesterase PaaI-like protein
MKPLEIPYNTFLGLKACRESSEYLFELPDRPQMRNHLNTIHASAQFALAEATSGELLARTFPDLSGSVLPVVRRVEVKYRRPAQGLLRSKASIREEMITKVSEELPRKKRVIIPVDVDIVDDDDHITMSATFDWFIQQLDLQDIPAR